MMQRKVSQKVEAEEQLKEAFKTLDKQNTGFLLVADLKHILTSIGEKMSKEEVMYWENSN
jgi:calcium-binding protein CML